MRKLIIVLLLLSLPALAAWKMTWKPFVLKSKTGNVTYSGKIPVLVGPGAEKINPRLRAWTLPPDVNALEKGDSSFYASNHYSEDIKVTVTRLTDRYLSLEYNSLGVMQRAAHPNVDFKGITFRLDTGAEVKLSEVIDVNGLRERIQAAGRKELPDVEIPARTKWDWVLTKDGVKFMNLLEGAGKAFTVTLPAHYVPGA